MKANGLTGVPTTIARVHPNYKGELCIQASGHPTTSQGENLLKEVLDFIFEDEPYQDNVRPDWLQGLELDRYYPNLKIAFEYQGFQHSYFVPNFHQSIQDLRNQKARDKLKKQLCRKQKVFLVRLEYWVLSAGQVCQRIERSIKKYKKWPRRQDISRIVQSRMPKAAGGRDRKALNKKCLKYKKLIKANYKSGKWVKHHLSYAKRCYPK